MPESLTPVLPAKRSIFFVFEGGGAKGIAHIGVLRAVEETPSFGISGAAGTSAGSIIASLVAAGFTATEIFSFDRKSQSFTSIFDLVDGVSGPVGLLKRRHWALIKIMRWIFRLPRTWITLVAILVAFLLTYPLVNAILINPLCSATSFNSFCLSIYSVLAYISLFLFVTLFGVAVYIALNFEGAASLGKLSSSLDKVLAAKVPRRSAGKVTFGDFRRAGKSLKIVASDLDSRKMRLFSTDTSDCQDVAVADAVAASCAIPFIFRPVLIQGKRYSDGGMVSNLPAWTFDEKLINDDRCWVVTSESQLPGRDAAVMEHSLHRSERSRGVKLFGQIGMTALFGASDLNTRGLAHHLQLSVPVNLGLLDFDVSPWRSFKEVRLASWVSGGLIEARLGEIEFLDHFHSQSTARLTALLGLQEPARLRCALVREMRLSGSEIAGYHLWACRGFSGCADENLKLARGGTLVEECLTARPDGAVVDLGTEEGRARFYEVGRPGYMKSVVPKDLKWAMAFRLADSKTGRSGLGRVSVALTVDGFCEIKGKLVDVRDELKNLSKAWEV